MPHRLLDKKVDRDWLNTNFPCMMACLRTPMLTLRRADCRRKFEEAYAMRASRTRWRAFAGACARTRVRQHAAAEPSINHCNPCTQALPHRAPRPESRNPINVNEGRCSPHCRSGSRL